MVQTHMLALVMSEQN